jgi:hypothetical protein
VLVASVMVAAIGAVARAEDLHHVHALTVDRRSPDALYLATHTGLVRLQPGKMPEWIGAQRFDLMGFTAHPSDPALLWASGHPDPETHKREGVANLGLIGSRDGGRTWQPLALRGEADFHAMTWSGRDGGTLYAWNAAGEGGLYRISTKTGKAVRVAARGLAIEVYALSASPDASGALFAGTREGLRVSRDSGESWTPVTGLAPGPVSAVAHHTAEPRTVFAYLHARDAGLLRSRDGGTTWQRVGFLSSSDAPVVALAAGPGERVALATSTTDVLRSKDGGSTWEKLLDRGRAGAPRSR